MSTVSVKAIIVAAGDAKRLRPLTNGKPKCLLEVNGEPLLRRLYVQLLSVGIDRIGLVIGFRSEMIRAYVRREFPLTRTKFIVNPKFGTTGNAFSLLLAREFYLAEEKRGAPLHPLLILDSDLWLDDSVLQLVVDGSAENKVAFRVDGEHDDEEVRVALRANGTIAAIGKNLHGNPNVGESVGVELFSPVAAKRMFEILEQRVRSGTGRTEFYEATFQQMIEEGIPLHAINIGKRFAMEVDTLEDFELLQRIARE